MASDLMQIAASGARAARGALTVTAQNIANASTYGYIRRTATMAELAAPGSPLRSGEINYFGVRIAGVERHADIFRQAEVRRTNSDLARADAELGGLKSTEDAVEQADIYSAIVDFEASLQQLASDPADPSLRAAVMTSADALARKFNLAAEGLDAVADGLQFEAGASVDDANTIAQELARINLGLSRTSDSNGDRATLLDKRDALLEKLSGIADISTTFDDKGSVTVKVGGAGGETLVTGGTASTMSMATAADGTISFAVAGNPVALNGGSLAGASLALVKVGETHAKLDALADQVAATVNAAQANGSALDGTPGMDLFGGAGAAGMRILTSDGSAIAAAAAGAPAGSRDGSNLTALRAALDADGPAKEMNAILFDVSSAVAGRSITRDALGAIAESARVALDQQAGVDLNTEAGNLIRFQQAFEASGRAMQVASDIFQTILAIR